MCVFVQVYVLRFAANTNTHREGRRKKERSKKGSFNGTWSASFMILWLRLSTCAPGDRGKAQVAMVVEQVGGGRRKVALAVGRGRR